MRSLNLSTKIISSMLISILGMVIISFSSYVGINSIGKELVEIAEYQIPINKATIELEKDILKEEILTYELFITSKNINSDEFKKAQISIEELEVKTNKAIIHAEDLVKKAVDHADTIETKNLYNNFLQELKTLEKEQKIFKKELSKFIHALKDGNRDLVLKEKKILIAELKQMDHNIEKLLTELTNLLEESALTAEHDEQRVLLIIEIISAIALLLSIIAAIVLIKYFKRTMNDFRMGIRGFFKYLGKETNDVNLLDDSVQDEFGEMSTAVNKYINRTKIMIEEDKEFINAVKNLVLVINSGNLNTRLEINTSNESFEELKTNLNEMLNTLESNIGKDTNIILDVLTKLSNQNFENNINNAEGKIEKSLNDVISLINKMLLENKKNGLTLDSSANNLLRNVDKLNTSSNEAAASLEETAAALEEITGNVSSTTLKINQMSKLADEVTKSTNEGEELASKTTKAMDEINTQVTSINDAITVIDQIAFQTNILSLNAAVEAATAGEAGKGFAVVAAEVRNLASRSAEAAKEIKDLVESANVKANEGKNIADKMIHGYTSLNSDINKTIELISDVTNAAKEQEVGILQINDAVNLLDQQTQQNARIASETQDIASHTSTIAKDILLDVDKKEFIGKDSIKQETPPTINNNSNPQIKQHTPAKHEPKKAPAFEPKNKPQIIETNSSSDDEWESF